MEDEDNEFNASSLAETSYVWYRDNKNKAKHFLRIRKIYEKFEFPSILADTDNDLWVPNWQNAIMHKISDFHFQ